MRLQAAVIAVGLFLAPGVCFAGGDVFDQFFRYAEAKNKVVEPHLPGETVDNFTGNLRIVQEDLALPGKAGLDLRIIRTYSSKIWGRADLLDLEPLLADKEPTPVGFGWQMHMGRLRNPGAGGEPTACGGGNYPVYEAPDGTARVFYPALNSNTKFTSRDFWTLTKNCPEAGGGICITSTAGLRLEFAQSAQFTIGPHPVWPVLGMVDVFGNRISFTYVASTGRPDRITDTWGRQVQFAYGTCGARACLQSITASGSGGSRTITYGYGGIGKHQVATTGCVS